MSFFISRRQYQSISCIADGPIFGMIDLSINYHRADDQHDRDGELHYDQYFSWKSRIASRSKSSFQDFYRLKRGEEQGRVQSSDYPGEYCKANTDQPKQWIRPWHDHFFISDRIEM